jgi:hypothetical protein
VAVADMGPSPLAWLWRSEVCRMVRWVSPLRTGGVELGGGALMVQARNMDAAAVPSASRQVFLFMNGSSL